MDAISFHARAHSFQSSTSPTFTWCFAAHNARLVRASVHLSNTSICKHRHASFAILDAFCSVADNSTTRFKRCAVDSSEFSIVSCTAPASLDLPTSICRNSHIPSFSTEATSSNKFVCIIKCPDKCNDANPSVSRTQIYQRCRLSSRLDSRYND